jgi:hypothetical protein
MQDGGWRTLLRNLANHKNGVRRSASYPYTTRQTFPLTLIEKWQTLNYSIKRSQYGSPPPRKFN